MQSNDERRGDARVVGARADGGRTTTHGSEQVHDERCGRQPPASLRASCDDSEARSYRVLGSVASVAMRKMRETLGRARAMNGG